MTPVRMPVYMRVGYGDVAEVGWIELDVIDGRVERATPVLSSLLRKIADHLDAPGTEAN